MDKVAIMMRIGLEAEALNNEGAIGNSMLSRQVKVLNGQLVDAISGEMLKHFHSRNLRLLADDNELCDTCKLFSPMKNGEIHEVDENLSASGNRVKNCIIDDVEGFMNAGKNKNEKSHSCIKFSWGLGVEDSNVETVFHSRVDPTDKNNKKKDTKDTTSNANTNSDQNTQMPFYRPLRSNEYAITVTIDMDRISFDDEKLVYTLPEDKVKTRQVKCLQALRNMFIDMEGAMCSTRLPHIRSIEGILVRKNDKNDVLVKYSARNDDYLQVNQNIATNSVVFNNIEEFVDVIDNILK